SGQPVWAVAFRPGKPELLSAGGDRLIRRWNPESGEPIGLSAGPETTERRGDPQGDRGAELFQACAACHSLSAGGESRSCPSLPANIQCRSRNLAATRSIVARVPNGLPQATQSNGSSCLTMRAGALQAAKSICGLRRITFSGQVAAHNPHCTQSCSAKRKVGRSGSSPSALVGQADTQDRHKVQPSTSMSRPPNGAPGSSGTRSIGRGAARCSSRKQNS